MKYPVNLVNPVKTPSCETDSFFQPMKLRNVGITKPISRYFLDKKSFGFSQRHLLCLFERRGAFGVTPSFKGALFEKAAKDRKINVTTPANFCQENFK
jgi:hypothetical protein